MANKHPVSKLVRTRFLNSKRFSLNKLARNTMRQISRILLEISEGNIHSCSNHIGTYGVSFLIHDVILTSIYKATCY